MFKKYLVVAAVLTASLALTPCGSKSASYIAGYNLIASLTGSNELVTSTADIANYCQQTITDGYANGYKSGEFVQGCEDATNDWWNASNGGVNYSVSIPPKQ